MEYVLSRMRAGEIVDLLPKLSPELSTLMRQILQAETRPWLNPSTQEWQTCVLVLNSDLSGLVYQVWHGFGQELSTLVGNAQGDAVGKQLALCLLLAMAPSVPDVTGLVFPGWFPLGTGVESYCRQAWEVLFTALLSDQWSSAVRALKVPGGRAGACEPLADLVLRSPHCKLRSLCIGNSGDMDWVNRSMPMNQLLAALEANSSVTHLYLEDGRADRREAQMLVAMLRKNSALQALCLHRARMTSEGLLHLCDALSAHQGKASPPIGLTRLSLANTTDIKAYGAVYLGQMLARNRSLRALELPGCGLKDGKGSLVDGLRANSTLEELDISDNTLGKVDADRLLQCLLTGNSNLKVLKIGRACAGTKTPASQDLAAMISSNRSLTKLDVTGASYSAAEWVTRILPAVGRNRNLRSVTLANCNGVRGEEVFQALLEMLRVNTSLEEIDVSGTPLDKDGRAEAVKKELLRNNGFLHALSAGPKANAKSCRVVLCGKEYAGKSTLCDALMHLHQQQRDATKVPKTRARAVSSSRDKELDKRTRGISIHVLEDEADVRISVWDFAGQREFHALHDFMFPSANNAATMFVLAFSPIISPLEVVTEDGEVKTLKELENELLYWLRFIASNSKPGSSAAKPSVVVVITNQDRLSHNLNSTDKASWLSNADEIVSRLAQQFRSLLTITPDPFIVNGLDMEDAGLNTWVKEIQETLKSKLHGVEAEPEICNQVVKRLATIPSPIISKQEFADLCKSVSQEGSLPYEDEGWKPVAAYLHDVGELIYHPKLDFIVKNPRWFGHGVLGHLLDLFSSQGKPTRYNPANNYRPRNGFLNKRNLRNLLQKAVESVPSMDPPGQGHLHVEPDELIQLMLLLDLCYEQSPGDPTKGYLLPALFEDKDSKAANGKRLLTWRDWEGASFIFVGRRLECADLHRTVLTDGFFPRLQVVLRKEALEKWVTANHITTWSLEKNLYSILVNGMEILVEYSGLSGYFVDILVKSSKPHSETVKFVHDNFLTSIRSFCASQEGCPGVILSEAIIRPDCLIAASPLLCAYRKDQAIAIDELAQRSDSFPKYIHSWGEVRNEVGGMVLPAGADSAASLLNGRDKWTPLEVEEEDCYPCSSVKEGGKRGLALLISMEKYCTSSGDREGGSVDRGSLRALADSLGFVVQVVVDYTAEELLEEVDEIAKSGVLAEDECFVCFVNAHGNTNEVGAHYIADQDGEMILLDDIVRPFRTCEQLRGKPKVFFVNSCRGSNVIGDAPGQSPAGQKAYQQSSEANEVRYVEGLSDCLMAFSTSGGAVSGRDRIHGTGFVKALVEAFNLKRQTTDVLSIISSANYAVVHEENYILDAGKKEVQVRQCPVVVHSLTKRLYWL